MSGTALTLAPAGWGGGWGAILSGAGAARRAAGCSRSPGSPAGCSARAGRRPPRLALALTQPMLLTARSTYSEPRRPAAPLRRAVPAARRGRRPAPRAGRAGRPAASGSGCWSASTRCATWRCSCRWWPGWRCAGTRAGGRWPLGTLAGAAYGVVDALGPTQPYVADLLELGSGRLSPALFGAGGAGRGRGAPGPPGHPLAAVPAVVAAGPRHGGGRAAALGVAGVARLAGAPAAVWAGPGTFAGPAVHRGAAAGAGPAGRRAAATTPSSRCAGRAGTSAGRRWRWPRRPRCC